MPMQHRRHPPREALDFPNPAQTDFGISPEQLRVARTVKLGKTTYEHPNVHNREIEALSSGGWNNVCGISGQKYSPVLHGFSHETTHSRHAFLQDRSFC